MFMPHIYMRCHCMCCIEEDKEANVKTIFGIFLLRIILVFYILLPIYYNNYSSVKHEKP